jgi:hypothetical protein
MADRAPARRVPIGRYGARLAVLGISAEVTETKFRGVVEFSGEGPTVAMLSFTFFPFYRLVISDDSVRVEGRWRLLRSLLPSRSCDLDKLVSARLRGTLVILYLPNDEWWSVSSGMRSTKIMRELESRGVSTTRDP